MEQFGGDELPEVHTANDLLRTADAVSAFIEAAEAYREDRDNKILKQAVADAAGRAHGAARMAEMITVHTDPPMVGGRSVAYDAIASWDSTIDPFTDQLKVAIDVAYQIRGTLTTMAADARLQEQSLVGRVARFVGFPGRVRRYLADRGYSASTQRAGFVTSIAVQLIVAVIAAVVAGLILFWIGASI